VNRPVSSEATEHPVLCVRHGPPTDRRSRPHRRIWFVSWHRCHHGARPRADGASAGGSTWPVPELSLVRPFGLCW